MKKKLRKGSALCLSAFLALTGLAAYQADAATAIDTEAAASITLSLSDTFSELTDLEETVLLYQVASVDAEGNYTGIGAFSGIGFSDVDSETSAAEWKALGLQCYDLIAEETLDARGEVAEVSYADPDLTVAIPEEEDFVIVSGSDFSPLNLGLYLVAAVRVDGAYDYYDFTPYLVALPGNAYGQTVTDEEGNETVSTDDAWIYNVTTELKPASHDLYGDLRVVKQLDTYNTSMGSATFVFEVKATKAYDGSAKVVYNNLVTITMTGAGSSAVTIADRIPAGSEVTVTERSAGSYKQVGMTIENGPVITTDKAAPLTVTFENDYTDELITENSLENKFSYEENGGWTVNNGETVFSNATGADGAPAE